MSDSYMTGPGAHETAAEIALGEGRESEGIARAILALAAAINRIASTYENEGIHRG